MKFWHNVSTAVIMSIWYRELMLNFTLLSFLWGQDYSWLENRFYHTVLTAKNLFFQAQFGKYFRFQLWLCQQLFQAQILALPADMFGLTLSAVKPGFASRYCQGNSVYSSSLQKVRQKPRWRPAGRWEQVSDHTRWSFSEVSNWFCAQFAGNTTSLHVNNSFCSIFMQNSPIWHFKDRCFLDKFLDDFFHTPRMRTMVTV